MWVFASMFELCVPPPPSPAELADKWIRQLNHEIRLVERAIRTGENNENKLKQQLRKEAKAGKTDRVCLKAMAQGVRSCTKEVGRLYSMKARISSVQMAVRAQKRSLRTCQILTASTEVMGLMNSLIKEPELRQTMFQLAKQMRDAGVIENLLDESTLGVGEEADEEEQEADEALDLIIAEVVADRLPSAPATRLSVAAAAAAAADATDLERLLPVPGSAPSVRAMVMDGDEDL
jgi:hypothetical protein